MSLPPSLKPSPLSAPATGATASWHVQRWLSDEMTPLALFNRLNTGSSAKQAAFLLESVEQDSRLARFSMLGVNPFASLEFKGKQATLQVLEPEAPLETQVLGAIKLEVPKAAHTLLQQVVQGWLPSQQLPALPEAVAHLPLLAGWVGVGGYGLTQALEDIPQQSTDPFTGEGTRSEATEPLPDGFYGFYPAVWVFDHQQRCLWFVALRLPVYSEAFWQEAILGQPQRVFQAPASTEAALAPLALSPLILPQAGLSLLERTSLFAQWATQETAERFQEKIQQCKALIQAGEVFQIVLSQRFSRAYTGAPLTVYRVLQALNPSPYAFYLQGPSTNISTSNRANESPKPQWVYLGASPETFLSGSRTGQLMLKALAGTRPRGQNEAEDLELESSLRNDPKELAEHKMLVDLARNDLGRCCVPGTVETGELAVVTRYSHVMHLTTEIKGQLKAEGSPYAMASACFPRGTVSGAPKIRAMQHLASLETERRGFYSGSVGYFCVTGAMDAAIAIRAVLLKDGQAHINAGAGLVADSDPVAEYEETRSKAFAVASAVEWALRLQNETPVEAPKQEGALS